MEIGLTIIPDKLKLSNGNIISSSDLILLSKIGKEYIVFKYKDKVIKIYRDLRENINKQSFMPVKIKDIMVVKTERILMPDDIVYDLDDNAVGYSQDLVLEEKDINNILIDKFIEELNYIDNDIDNLNHKNILVNDSHSDNVMYNGKIYIIDVGKYTISLLTPYYSIVHHNILEFNQLISSLFSKANITKYEYCKLYSYLKKMSYKIGTERFLDVIEEYANRNMTLEEYVYNLVK